jgi:hypothetical protein
MLDASWVVFFKDTIFTVKQIPQIWRLVTPFLITGPKFGLLMDPYFLYTYGSGLESRSPRFTESGSFFVYNVFVMACILVRCIVVLSCYTTTAIRCDPRVSARPVLLAEAVPESEEEYPPAPRPTFAKQSQL